MCVVGNRRKPVRKLPGVGIPVSYSTEPTCIKMKHLKAKFSRIADHIARLRLIDLHSAAPTIVYDHRIGRRLDGIAMIQHFTNPSPQMIAGSISPAIKSTEE